MTTDNQLMVINWASFEELKNIKGVVYRIFDTWNGMSYIGKTIHTFFQRYSISTMWKYVTNKPLQNRIKKYGMERFRIQILSGYINSNDLLLFLESFYAKFFNTYFPNGYNLIPCGMEEPPLSKTKTVLVRDENETIITITNLREFQKATGVSRHGISRVFDKEKLFYKNYHNINFTKYESSFWTFAKSNKNSLRCLISPKGILHFFYNIREFCKKNGLERKYIGEVLMGKRKIHKKWTIPS